MLNKPGLARCLINRGVRRSDPPVRRVRPGFLMGQMGKADSNGFRNSDFCAATCVRLAPGPQGAVVPQVFGAVRSMVSAGMGRHDRWSLQFGIFRHQPAPYTQPPTVRRFGVLGFWREVVRRTVGSRPGHSSLDS